MRGKCPCQSKSCATKNQLREMAGFFIAFLECRLDGGSFGVKRCLIV